MCNCTAPWERPHRETTSRKNKGSSRMDRRRVTEGVSEMWRQIRGEAFEEEEEEVEEKAAD